MNLSARADQLGSGRGERQPSIGKVAGKGDGILGIEAGDFGFPGVVDVVTDHGEARATADADEPGKQLIEALAEVDGGQGCAARDGADTAGSTAGTGTGTRTGTAAGQLADSAFEGPNLAGIRVDQHRLIAGQKGRQVTVRARDQQLAGGRQGDRDGLSFGRIQQQDLVAHFILILSRPHERREGSTVERLSKWGGWVGGIGGETIG